MIASGGQPWVRRDCVMGDVGGVGVVGQEEGKESIQVII